MIVQTKSDSKNIKIGKRPDRNALKNAGEGVNNVSSPLLTKQSKETNGVDVDPIRSAGPNKSVSIVGNFMLNESMAVMICT